MLMKTTRRSFLKHAALTGAMMPLIISYDGFGKVKGRKLRHASIGTGGMGNSDFGSLTSHPDLEIIAVCDVDKNRMSGAAKRYPNARTYQDWRELLDKEHKNLDSVNVSTPDHMHAPIAMTAMNHGLNIYCQKPLGHDIYECRRLAEVATSQGLVTQMGIQIHSHPAYRMAVKMIQDGMIGRVKKVHSWCGKGWVGPPERRPDKQDPVPENINWDLWLGTAPQRPYVGGIYHPGQWRRWIDFGTGTQGDMACHIMDPVFSALEFTAPVSVVSYQSPPFEETYSPKNKILMKMAKTRFTTGVIDFWWYDSWREQKLRPSLKAMGLPEGTKLPNSGSVFMGEKGSLLLPHIGGPQPLPLDKFKTAIKAFRAKNKFPGVNHYHQYVDACLGKGETTVPFSFGGALTETVLMGCVANRYQKKTLLWDAKNLQFTNNRDANKHLKRTYRKGWEVKGL